MGLEPPTSGSQDERHTIRTIWFHNDWHKGVFVWIQPKMNAIYFVELVKAALIIARDLSDRLECKGQPLTLFSYLLDHYYASLKTKIKYNVQWKKKEKSSEVQVGFEPTLQELFLQ